MGPPWKSRGPPGAITWAPRGYHVGPQGQSGGPPEEITWAPRGINVGPQGQSRGPPGAITWAPRGNHVGPHGLFPASGNLNNSALHIYFHPFCPHLAEVVAGATEKTDALGPSCLSWKGCLWHGFTNFFKGPCGVRLCFEVEPLSKLTPSFSFSLCPSLARLAVWQGGAARTQTLAPSLAGVCSWPLLAAP